MYFSSLYPYSHTGNKISKSANNQKMSFPLIHWCHVVPRSKLIEGMENECIYVTVNHGRTSQFFFFHDGVGGGGGGGGGVVQAFYPNKLTSLEEEKMNFKNI